MASHIYLNCRSSELVHPVLHWDAFYLTKAQYWRYCSIGLFRNVAKTQICSGFTVF